MLHCNKALCWFTLIIVCLCMPQISTAGTIDELSKSVVFLRHRFQVTEKKEGKTFEVWYKNPTTEKYEPKLQARGGTGFIVRHNSKDYLITAKHVALALPKQAEIIMNLPSNKSISITFESISNILPGSRWFMHSSADIAVHPLIFQGKTEQKSFPKSMLWDEKEQISLLSESYILGFPLFLGVLESLSPLAKKTQIASYITSIDTPGIDSGLKFYLLDQALAQGYSGAPVVYLKQKYSGLVIQGVRHKAGMSYYLLGVQSSVVSDKTGGKISLVTPISYLEDIFNSPDFLSYEKGYMNN